MTDIHAQRRRVSNVRARHRRPASAHRRRAISLATASERETTAAPPKSTRWAPCTDGWRNVRRSRGNRDDDLHATPRRADRFGEAEPQREQKEDSGEHDDEDKNTQQHTDDNLPID